MATIQQPQAQVGRRDVAYPRRDACAGGGLRYAHSQPRATRRRRRSVWPLRARRASDLNVAQAIAETLALESPETKADFKQLLGLLERLLPSAC